MKVVINNCHGGFGLSDDMFKLYLERKGIEYYTKENPWGGFGNNNLMFYATKDPEGKYLYDKSIERNDPELVKIVEEFGNEAGSWAAALKIVEIPDDVEWQIEEYDGLEWVAEKHRTWS